MIAAAATIDRPGSAVIRTESPASAHAGALIGLKAFALSGRGPAILASLFAISVFGGLYIVPLYAIMQTRCDADFRSRVIAVNNVMNALFMVGGAAITMILLKMQVKITDIFLMIGLVNLPVAFLVRRIVRERRKARHAA